MTYALILGRHRGARRCRHTVGRPQLAEGSHHLLVRRRAFRLCGVRAEVQLDCMPVVSQQLQQGLSNLPTLQCHGCHTRCGQRDGEHWGSRVGVCGQPDLPAFVQQLGLLEEHLCASNQRSWDEHCVE